MINLKRFFKTSESLKRDTALAERRARLERITGGEAKHWTTGKEFDQNKVTAKEVKV